MKKNEKYKIEGMSCASCQARVEKAVSKLNGIKSCSVSLLTNSMIVDRDENLSQKEIMDSVKNAGYKASLMKEDESAVFSKNNETKKLLIILILSVIFLVPLFYIYFTYMNGFFVFSLENHPFVIGIIGLVLSSIIIGLNYRFFVSGTKAIFHGGPNMDTLVALGSGVAYIYGLVIFILMCLNLSNNEELMRLSMNLTFETAGMVTTLITIGKLLESYSKGKTTTAIKKLLELKPNIAHKYIDGNITDINSELLLKNDLFIVRPGELFPADAIIIEGYASIDESSLTGESIPIDKKNGDFVKTGTINLNGSLICKAIAVGEETTINKIAKMVENASSTKTKISKLADKISLFFVPIVIGLAIITFTIWMFVGQSFIDYYHLNVTPISYAISRAISVLVISCPCALGLATPVAIMVASGKGAKNGILYKSAQVLEEAGKIDIAVFDKTGTLTKGETEVDLVLGNNIPSEELIKYAYSVEFGSAHPYAKAISKYALEKEIQATSCVDFKDLVGVGVSGKINGSLIEIVKESYLKEKNITNEFTNETNEIKNRGATPIFVLKDNKLAGLISISDQVREDAIESTKRLKSIGISVVMLTGDNEITARNIAKQIGIEHVIANVLPNEKYEVIKELQKQGKVMMVGDGINDSVALTQANIGVAIGKGSDIAIESADIVLAKDSLLDIYGAIILSKKAYKNIIENLCWAFVYNIIMIPIAAGALSPVGLINLYPWMGAAAMSLSSITVVLNALRLNLVNIYKNQKHPKKSHILLSDMTFKRRNNNMKVYVEGMMCMHCVNRVKNALEQIDGVKSADVTLENGLAEVSTSKDVSDEIIKAAIENSGYKVVKIER